MAKTTPKKEKVQNFSRRKKRPEKPEVPEAPEGLDEVAEEDRPTLLPDPTGYKVLIALPAPEEKTAGGIVKSADTVRSEQISSCVGMVLKLGPDAYGDKSRYPTGPFCKEGDFVMFRAYSGTRFTVYGEEFRLLNDDSIEATVDDPRGIAKV